jgi:hypothetical protein
MKKHVRAALIGGLGIGLLQAQAPTAAAQCQQVGGMGIGLFEGFASFMAEAAMKNSAKARVGENAKLGKVNTRCAWKTVNYECHARAQACR